MEDSRDRKEDMATRVALAGGGMGICAFAVYGVINASFIGGIMGLNLAGAVMGFPVESTLLAKVLVALGMLSGVMVAGLIFVAAGAAAGWMAGKLIDAGLRLAHHGQHIGHQVRH